MLLDCRGVGSFLESSVEQELILIQLLMDLDVQPMAVQEGILAEQARAIQFPVIPAQGHGIGSNFKKSKQPKSKWLKPLLLLGERFYQCASCGKYLSFAMQLHTMTKFYVRVKSLVPKSGDHYYRRH